MKSLVIIVIAVVAGIAIGLGAGYFLFFQPPPPEPPPEAAAPAEPPVAPESDQNQTPMAPAPSSIEEQVPAINEAIADVITSNQSKEVSLVVTEREANEQAAKILANLEIAENMPVEVTAVRLDFKTGNNVLVDVETTSLGFDLTIEVMSRVSIEAGKPAVEVTEVNFGFVPLPSSAKQQITDFIRQQSEDLYDQLIEMELGTDRQVDLEFKEIVIEEDSATVTAIITPKD